MVTCKNCGEKIDALTALENARYSWPQLQTIWYACVRCCTGNHIRFLEDTIQRIEISGAPGPEWEIVQTERCPGIGVEVKPAELVISLAEHKFVIPARS